MKRRGAKRKREQASRGGSTCRLGCLFSVIFAVLSFRADGSVFNNGPKWPNGIVPYQFDPDISPEHQAEAIAAFQEWELAANLKFHPRTIEKRFLQVENEPPGTPYSQGGNCADSDCNSYIRMSTWNRAGLCHEIGHALGLIHEQQRPDRDDFVTILTANMAPDTFDDMGKASPSNVTVNSPYDFESIMHYDRHAKAKSPDLDTIVPKPPYLQYIDIMGRVLVLSRYDRSGMAQMYGPGPTLSPIVTDSSDGGPGSLRAALYYAQDHPGSTIRFQIPTTDPTYKEGIFTLARTAAVPDLVNGTVLDGVSQPASPGVNVEGPRIRLDGSHSDAYTAGLRIMVANCRVAGITFDRFSGNGMEFGDDAHDNDVEGCAFTRSGQNGISISGAAHDIRIGGTSSDAGNVVSGNGAAGISLGAGVQRIFIEGNIVSSNKYQGIWAEGPGSADLNINGNRIGTDPSGTLPLANGYDGIGLQKGVKGAMIQGNLISGNGGTGILIVGPDTSGVTIDGNRIGTDANGTKPLGNGNAGIVLESGVTNVTVQGNVISSNKYQGIWAQGPAIADLTITDNRIGTDLSGTSPLANGYDGVGLQEGLQTVTIRDNLISGNRSNGIWVAGPGASGVTIDGNRIGADESGAKAIPNVGGGISFDKGVSGSVIGPGNVISGNGGNGIWIADPLTKGNMVIGNLLGLDSSGKLPLPNAYSGITLAGGATGNIVGGVDPADANTISGNGAQGVVLIDAGTSLNRVLGNRIGTDPSGAVGVPNRSDGVSIFRAAGPNSIGGAVRGEGNLISGNSGNGIGLFDPGTHGNLILGNTIGSDVYGSRPLPNTFNGVYFGKGAAGNTVGGASPGEGNRIAFNKGDGVALGDPTATSDTLRGNAIFSNGGLAIGFPTGFVSNDRLDRDTGANSLQNYPVIASASGSAASTVLTGTLSSTPGRAFAIDLFASRRSGANGSGDGEIYAGSLTVTTDSNGEGPFTSTVQADLTDQFVSATATDLSTGDTSEIGPSRRVALSAAPAPGDVNGDGKVTVTDVTLVLRFATGLAMLGATQKKAADLNGDGQIDVRDAFLILQHIVGIAS